MDNFSDREATGGEREVELSQRLALYRDSESEPIWSPAEQTVREKARRTRRDFYLVQQIDLPRNLSLGTYSLKITVEDKVSKAQAESRMTIRVVAGGRSATGE